MVECAIAALTPVLAADGVAVNGFVPPVPATESDRLEEAALAV